MWNTVCPAPIPQLRTRRKPDISRSVPQAYIKCCYLRDPHTNITALIDYFDRDVEPTSFGGLSRGKAPLPPRQACGLPLAILGHAPSTAGPAYPIRSARCQTRILHAG